MPSIIRPRAAMALRCAARPSSVTSIPARCRKPPNTEPSAPAPAIRTRIAARRVARAAAAPSGTLLQHAAQDLAGRVLRNGVDELDDADLLIAGDALGYELHQLRRAWVHARLEH